jgi:hypothetical protein
LALLVIILGALLGAGGAFFLILGFDVVMTERGNAMTIGGTIALSSGIITIGVGLALLRLTQILNAMEEHRAAVVTSDMRTPMHGAVAGAPVPTAFDGRDSAPGGFATGAAVAGAAASGLAAAGIAAGQIAAGGRADAAVDDADGAPASVPLPEERLRTPLDIDDILADAPAESARHASDPAASEAEPLPEAAMPAVVEEPRYDLVEETVPAEEAELEPNAPSADHDDADVPEGVDDPERSDPLADAIADDDETPEGTAVTAAVQPGPDAVTALGAPAHGDAPEAESHIPGDFGTIAHASEDQDVDRTGAGDPAQDAEDASASANPDAATEPAPAPSAADVPTQAQRAVLGSYRTGGRTYTMFSDGTVEAALGDHVERFESMDALRAHLART